MQHICLFLKASCCLTFQHTMQKETNTLFYSAEMLSSEGAVNKVECNMLLLERWNPALSVSEGV